MFKHVEVMDRNLDLGQHFLRDEATLEQIAGQIPHGAKVLEIGGGEGSLTSKLAAKASRVVCVEIDPRWAHKLSLLREKYRNLEVRQTDALNLDFDDFSNFWTVGNIPYHITEPLITRLAAAEGIKEAVLMVGKSFAKEATALTPVGSTRDFGKLSLVVQTFFTPNVVGEVPKMKFDPPPRTDSVILKLARRSREDYDRNLALFLLRELFMSAKHSPKVKNVLVEGLIRFKLRREKSKTTEEERPVLTKNEARDLLAQVFEEGDSELLDKSFEQLNNERYKKLYEALLEISI